ncbi:MAG: YwiC-like family protein [Terriglobales bacterium]
MTTQPQCLGHKEVLHLDPEAGRSRLRDETAKQASSGQQARTRALVIPREHGAWGLLFVPLFTGVAAGIASVHRIGPLLLFTAATFFLFWLRTPLESLAGSGVITAHTRDERRVAWLASLILAAASVFCLAVLLWGGRNSRLVHIGLFAALALAIQTALRRLGRPMRMVSQVAGAVALTATAPAAYYIGSGRLGNAALALWIANWCFAWNQIHFVQLRIHAGRASGIGEKFAEGKYFFAGQVLLVAALLAASLSRLVPALVIVAFIPALVRGTYWFVRAPRPLNVRKLGWSELRQGIAFGILLAAAFLIH